MKNLMITLAILVIVCDGFSQNFNTMNLTNEEVEVIEVVKEWNDSFSDNDPEKYFTFIHDDLTLFIASSPYRIDGKADDRVEFEYSLKKGNTRVWYFQELQPKVQRYGDTAVVTYYTRGSYGIEGQENTIYLKETNVLVKENGGWKIVHIHVSKTE